MEQTEHMRNRKNTHEIDKQRRYELKEAARDQLRGLSHRKVNAIMSAIADNIGAVEKSFMCLRVTDAFSRMQDQQQDRQTTQDIRDFEDRCEVLQVTIDLLFCAGYPDFFPRNENLPASCHKLQRSFDALLQLKLTQLFNSGSFFHPNKSRLLSVIIYKIKFLRKLQTQLSLCALSLDELSPETKEERLAGMLNSINEEIRLVGDQSFLTPDATYERETFAAIQDYLRVVSRCLQRDRDLSDEQKNNIGHGLNNAICASTGYNYLSKNEFYSLQLLLLSEGLDVNTRATIESSLCDKIKNDNLPQEKKIEYFTVFFEMIDLFCVDAEKKQRAIQLILDQCIKANFYAVPQLQEKLSVLKLGSDKTKTVGTATSIQNGRGDQSAQRSVSSVRIQRLSAELLLNIQKERYATSADDVKDKMLLREVHLRTLSAIRPYTVNSSVEQAYWHMRVELLSEHIFDHISPSYYWYRTMRSQFAVFIKDVTCGKVRATDDWEEVYLILQAQCNNLSANAAGILKSQSWYGNDVFQLARDQLMQSDNFEPAQDIYTAAVETMNDVAFSTDEAVDVIWDDVVLTREQKNILFMLLLADDKQPKNVEMKICIQESLPEKIQQEANLDRLQTCLDLLTLMQHSPADELSKCEVISLVNRSSDLLSMMRVFFEQERQDKDTGPVTQLSQDKEMQLALGVLEKVAADESASAVLSSAPTLVSSDQSVTASSAHDAANLSTAAMATADDENPLSPVAVVDVSSEVPAANNESCMSEVLTVTFENQFLCVQALLEMAMEFQVYVWDETQTGEFKDTKVLAAVYRKQLERIDHLQETMKFGAVQSAGLAVVCMKMKIKIMAHLFHAKTPTVLERMRTPSNLIRDFRGTLTSLEGVRQQKDRFLRCLWIDPSFDQSRLESMFALICNATASLDTEPMISVFETLMAQFWCEQDLSCLEDSSIHAQFGALIEETSPVTSPRDVRTVSVCVDDTWGEIDEVYSAIANGKTDVIEDAGLKSFAEQLLHAESTCTETAAVSADGLEHAVLSADDEVQPDVQQLHVQTDATGQQAVEAKHTDKHDTADAALHAASENVEVEDQVVTVQSQHAQSTCTETAAVSADGLEHAVLSADDEVNVQPDVQQLHVQIDATGQQAVEAKHTDKHDTADAALHAASENVEVEDQVVTVQSQHAQSTCTETAVVSADGIEQAVLSADAVVNVHADVQQLHVQTDATGQQAVEAKHADKHDTADAALHAASEDVEVEDQVVTVQSQHAQSTCTETAVVSADGIEQAVLSADAVVNVHADVQEQPVIGNFDAQIPMTQPKAIAEAMVREVLAKTIEISSHPSTGGVLEQQPLSDDERKQIVTSWMEGLLSSIQAPVLDSGFHQIDLKHHEQAPVPLCLLNPADLHSDLEDSWDRHYRLPISPSKVKVTESSVSSHSQDSSLSTVKDHHPHLTHMAHGQSQTALKHYSPRLFAPAAAQASPHTDGSLADVSLSYSEGEIVSSPTDSSHSVQIDP